MFYEAYLFNDYWEDIGTHSSFFDANLALTDQIDKNKPGVSVEASPIAYSSYEKKAITSTEWSPHEASTFAFTSEDDQLIIWDLALERDEEEEAEFSAKLKEQANAPEDLPSQLLFVHQGQKNLKELHWHPQIPGMLISTAEDGFNVLMSANIATTLSSVDG